MSVLTITEGLLSFTEIFMYSIFFSKLTESKYSKSVTVLLSLLLNGILTFLINTLGMYGIYKVEIAALKITLFSVSLIILLKAITKSSIKQIIKAIVIVVIFMFFSDFGGLYIYAVSMGKRMPEFIGEWETTTPYFKIMGLYMYCAVYSVSSSVYMVFMEKISLRVKVRTVILIAAFFVFQMEILIFIYMKIINDYSKILLILGALNSIFINAIYYAIQFLLVESLQQQEQKRELEFLKAHKVHLIEYYELAATYSEETNKLRNDITNQLKTISLLFENNYQSAGKMLSKVEEHLKASKSYFRSGNVIVDTVLTIKELQARNNNINIDIMTGKVSALNIEDIDMCNIISNIFDNAIEAVTRLSQEQRKIEIKIGERQGYLIMKCENTFNPEDSIYNGSKFITTKINKKNHGYGLKIIQDVVNKYDGDFSTEISGNIFTATAFLKIE